MGMIKINHVGAVARVDKYTAGDISALGIFDIYLPVYITSRGSAYSEQIVYKYNTASNSDKTPQGFMQTASDHLLRHNILLGYLNGTDTVTTTFRIQYLDLSKGEEPIKFDKNYVTTQITDGTNNYNAGAFDPEVQAYDPGTTFYIPNAQILRLEKHTSDIRLYYQTNKYLKFSLGTVDTTHINRKFKAGDSGEAAYVATTLTASTFATADKLDQLEIDLFQAISESQTPGVIEFNYDTANFSVSSVTVGS